jgi:hypothetical protein
VKLKNIPPYTIITGAAAVAWLGSFVIRAVKPDFALGAAADALMTTVVGYWFTADHKAGNLLNEVVTKVGVPYISTAHTDKPTPAYTPKPEPKPKQGGLPWN